MDDIGEVQILALPDGRALEVRTAGPEDGPLLLLHHGTPGSALIYPPFAQAAAARGLRMVAYARPGYSGSTPRPGRRVADAAADVAHILAALGAETFRTMGWSGGGPHALACAARLADRCLATVVVAGVAPYPAEGLDWLAGMAPENVEEFTLTMRGEADLRPFLQSVAGTLSNVDGANVAAALGELVCDADKACLTGDYTEWMAAGLRAGLSAGIEGWCEDDLAFVSDWGFDLATCRSVTIWQGGQDRMVPAAHGRWLADRIPGARRRLLDDEGHLSIALGAFEQILDDLLDPARP
jgi:pimeloyl-ACP methyl ester carboxylesterase